MKLGKTSRLILAVGVFIVAFASLGIAHSQQLREQDQLNDELTIAETRLSKFQIKQLSYQQEELQERLQESSIKLTEAKDRLHQTVESINVTDKFFAIAQSCGVEVTNISSSNIGREKLGNVACSMITLTAVVVGDTSNLISFVIRLNSDFTTGFVKSAQISIPETADDESSVDDRPTANILMVVYAYEGD